MKKKKDVFTKVEADARKMLEHPETAGAAKTSTNASNSRRL